MGGVADAIPPLVLLQAQTNQYYLRIVCQFLATEQFALLVYVLGLSKPNAEMRQ